MSEYDDLVRADELKVGKDAYSAEHVDRSALAELMLLWEKKRAELDMIELSIRVDVLALAKTQDVGNVRATYSKGRNEYDYETSALSHLGEDDFEGYKQYVPERVIPASVVVDYRKACKDNHIEPNVVKEGTPSVKVKLLE